MAKGRRNGVDLWGGGVDLSSSLGKEVKRLVADPTGGGGGVCRNVVIPWPRS
jgi:hypothetical protein